MADRRTLTLLMFWAGIMALASSSFSATPNPDSSSSHASSQSTSPMSSYQSPSPVPVTQPIHTMTPTAIPSQCSFNVIPIKFGLQIEMINVTTDKYSISTTEVGPPQSPREDLVPFSERNSTHNVLHLKPCTKYEVKVVHPSTKISCNSTVNQTTTLPIAQADVTRGSCLSGSVCYQSGWHLMLSNRTESNGCNNGTCFRPGYEEICSTITTKIMNFGSCGDSSSFLEYINIDYLNTMQIKTKVSKSLPANIVTEFPPMCANLSVNYTCSEMGNNNVTKSVLDLEPYINYTCTGQVKDNNVLTKKTISINQFQIDCGFEINASSGNATNTSIPLQWSTTNTSCQGLSHKHLNLSYTCSCSHRQREIQRSPDQNEGKFNITGLSPYTNYNCTIQLKYKDLIRKKKVIQKKTKEGIPDTIKHMEAKVLEHNVIHVTCASEYNLTKFHGLDKGFKAQLSDGTNQSNSKCKFKFKDLSYSTDYIIKVVAYNGLFEGPPTTQTVSTLYNNKAVIGFLVFLIILTSLALLLVVYKIYVMKRKRSQEMGESLMLISSTNDEDSLMSVEPMAAEILLEAYKRKLADEARLFFAEFQSIPRIFSRYSVKEAKRTCNAPKNRYVDILPYDYTRVQLTTGNGQAGCDYINASFINGFTEPKKYIAAQGPKTETVSDFWRMIWEQNSSIIVMVTRCEEGNKIKCAQYWPSPDQHSEIFEEFVVKLNSEEQSPDYTIRHLSLINKREKNSDREVTHVQFMTWPDHGTPGEPHLLLKLRRRVNSFKNLFSGPIVVHCSAGVGRTGTYICIDSMMECLEAEGRVDVYGSVVNLRRQRGHMVQVEPQYILIHQALLEHNQFGETEISLSVLHNTLGVLRHQNDNEPTLLEEEFERLPTFKNWRTFNAGITEENKKKNRSSSVIPYDYNRVLLRLDEGQSLENEPNSEDEEESSDEEDEDSTKYINASHIDGYWSPRVFMAAQTPLTDTMEDFWLMVYQKKVQTIVMLSDSSDGEEDSVYWDRGDKTFGDMEVELTTTDTFPTFVSRNFLIRHMKRKESRSVKHYQFLKWAGSELPEKPQDLTDMIKNMKIKSFRDKPQRNTPIVVHCNDGSSRSGIFCALWILMDSAETEKLVDVFQVTKTLRKERQGMLSSLDQYQFLYKALENMFPVTNGEATQAPVADSVLMVNETKAEQEKVTPPRPKSNGQQGAEADSSPLMIREDNEKEESSVSMETSNNGPSVSMEL